ncbi:hypothetical protein IE81DRAFT_321596 [Ceraceosorus guamensis]|uniref:Uncharacterized protein n=1 Tax=Ceraceosorus guamensis TaxID=1522189 RepID=A0A316W3T2_9BASI|nr:hypothetical protein IE81DRAFT_321596 [Ceraceosorus guamensis]PWN44194.1 hypothetical protein IE81DRAFT_321596 [Ceraceosorus guamensis]
MVRRSLSSFPAWLGLPAEHDEVFDPQARFVTSYILPPWLLALIRTIFALYALVTLILDFVFGGADQFAYFTVLSYSGITSWFLVSAFQGFTYTHSLARWHKTFTSSHLPTSDKLQYPQSWLSKKFARPLQFAHLLLWSTVATYPLILTIVFWSALSGGALDGLQRAWQNISVHGLNLAFAMIDVIVIGRGPMLPWSHLLFVVCLLALYVGVAYIHYSASGDYVYDFLDPGFVGGQGPLAGVVIGVGVGCCLSFLVGQFLIWLREWLAALLQRSGGWGSAKPVGVPDDALVPTKFGPGPDGEGGQRSSSAGPWRQRWPPAISHGVGSATSTT